MGLFNDRSVNETGNGAVPEVGTPLKSATGAAGGVASTAWYAFNRPPVATFPDRELFASTVERIIVLISAEESDWFTAFTSAATPETWGVAMDVPLLYV